MNLHSPPVADPRIVTILDMTTRLAHGDLSLPDYTPRQNDAIDQIASELETIAARLSTYEETNAQTEAQSQAMLDVMFAAAAQDYTARAPVTERDSVFDALATGLNMLLEELAASQESAVRLQEEIISAQEAAIRELSTPLIPISDSILIMPLIGSIDSRRAGHIFERILHGVAETRADTIIVDITGVAVVDTQVAGLLLQTAQAALLLGAKVILTGIRPEVAQTLVGLGVNMRDLVTRSTLQAGIEYATRTTKLKQ